MAQYDSISDVEFDVEVDQYDIDAEIEEVEYIISDLYKDYMASRSLKILKEISYYLSYVKYLEGIDREMVEN